MKASREAAASSYKRCRPPERDGTGSNPACSYQRMVCTLQPLALARVPMECAPGITFPLESTIAVDCRMLASAAQPDPLRPPDERYERFLLPAETSLRRHLARLPARAVDRHRPQCGDVSGRNGSRSGRI